MKLRTTSLAAGLAVVALGAGLVVPALAQDGDIDTTERSTVEERRADRHAAFAEALADELGLDVDRVTEALDDVRVTMAAERGERGPGMGGLGMGGGPGMHGGAGGPGLHGGRGIGGGAGPCAGLTDDPTA